AIINNHFERVLDGGLFFSAADVKKLYSMYNSAFLDDLTKAMGRKSFDEDLKALPEKGGYLCLFDVDKFKNINDTFGHLLGDEVLMKVVKIFKYSPVEGADANALPDQVPEEVKEERWNRFMQLQQQISAERLQEKVGREILVIIDEVDEEGAIGRSMADAPEIDGAVYLNGETNVKPGDILRVKVEHADEYDLWGSRV
ncbi:diguanylate cyclase domain-containing protein, partial [Escherichia sp. TWPC-MK]